MYQYIIDFSHWFMSGDLIRYKKNISLLLIYIKKTLVKSSTRLYFPDNGHLVLYTVINISLLRDSDMLHTLHIL